MVNCTVTSTYANIPGAKVRELQLLVSNEANTRKNVLLVEGADDRKFYGKYVDESHVVFSVQDSCYYIPLLLLQASSNPLLKNRVIGIKDTDFDQLSGKCYAIDGLFLTDTHDWETMTMTAECEKMIAMEALNRLEAGVFMQVMNDLTNLSYLRYYNAVEICEKGLDGIRFKGYTISNLYDGAHECSVTSTLSALQDYANNSRLAHFPTDIQLQQFKAAHPVTDYYHLSCGHDVVHGLVCRLTMLRGSSPEIGEKDISRLMRACFTNDYFRNTQVYKDVLFWSQAHHTTVWSA